MIITHINNTDLPGSRFNGHDLQIELNQMGHTGYQLVAEKLGDHPNTASFVDSAGHSIRQSYIEFERRLSMHSLIYPYGKKIMKMPQFQEADVVHYHLVHNYILSLFDLEEMFELKPSVWTLHDPWVFTGHCIHPMGCNKWKTGCYSCPHLDTVFTMEEDKAFQMWNVKKDLYPKYDVDIVVASKFMLDFVKESPLMSKFERVHLIPFGIKIDQFHSVTSMRDIRASLKIPENHFVIAFRADRSKFKGLNLIKEMLDKLAPSVPVTILTAGENGLLNRFRTKYKVIELGWVTDDEMMAKFYSACDVFLMPSKAEAFGMMAIEAMASSKAVIVCEGTALPDVTFAPECGIVVAQDDAEQLCTAVTELMNNPDECKGRGRQGRKLAEKHYDYKRYVNQMIDLYEEISKRRKR